jgi:hypothetical protein
MKNKLHLTDPPTHSCGRGGGISFNYRD